MRLYLSSYGLGDEPGRLRSLVRGKRRGVVIVNALDHASPERRSREVGAQRAALCGLGLTATELDLRSHTPDTIGAALAGIDFCWVGGGNVFVLRQAMAHSGADTEIAAALADDRFAYAGFSAGPCVLAPSLRGLELCDPVEQCERLYGDVRYDGLGVLDRPVVPHLDSPGHPETSLLRHVARRYAAQGQPFHALSDGQVLVIDGAESGVI